MEFINNGFEEMRGKLDAAITANSVFKREYEQLQRTYECIEAKVMDAETRLTHSE